MRVLMLDTRYGSEDGFVVRRFYRTQHYDMADSLAAAFIRLGVAEHIHTISPLADGFPHARE